MTTAELVKLAEEIQHEIHKMKDSIWSDFAPIPFILYDDTIRVAVGADWSPEYNHVRGDIWLAEGADNALFGNTACEYHGRVVAIWDIRTWDNDIVLAECVGNVVHEMFHAFQHNFAEIQWGNTFALLDYSFTPRTVALLMAERRVMSEYLQGANALTCFQKIASLRIALTADAGDELVLINKSLETGEGMAYYVELCAAARVLNSKPAIEKRGLDALTAFGSDMLVKYRAGCYAPGAVFCLIADDLTPGWHKKWSQSGEQIYDWLVARVSPALVEADIYDGDLQIAEDIINEFYADKAKKIADFMAQPMNVYDKDLQIASLDPMNIICHEKICLHLRAVNLKIDGVEQLFSHPVAHQYEDGLWDVKSVLIPS